MAKMMAAMKKKQEEYDSHSEARKQITQTLKEDPMAYIESESTDPMIKLFKRCIWDKVDECDA